MNERASNCVGKWKMESMSIANATRTPFGTHLTRCVSLKSTVIFGRGGRAAASSDTAIVSVSLAMVAVATADDTMATVSPTLTAPPTDDNGEAAGETPYLDEIFRR